MGDVCPTCGEEYERLGQHWAWNEDHRPELTTYQKDIITGLMMSDGTLDRSGKNPYLQVQMITKEYLKWFNSVFGVLSTGVRLTDTAKDSAKKARDSGFQSDAKAENYHDQWTLKTRSTPVLWEWDWYTGNDGKKVWPEDITLTPTVLTHLYAGDGSWRNDSGNNYIQIGASNERGNEDKIDSYFKNAGLPTPNRYDEYQYKDGSWMMSIAFNTEESKELFEYMDPAPPGFEYKFPEQYR